MAGYLSGSDPEHAAEGIRPSGYRSKAGRCLLALGPTRNRTVFPAEVSAHAVQPEAATDIIAFLLSDAASPVSGAGVPAYGA